MEFNNNRNGYSQFSRSDSALNVKKRFQEILDNIEPRIQFFREQAIAVEKEKTSLLNVLTSLKEHKDLRYLTQNEIEELETHILCLISRLLTVEITVTTPRTEDQQKALEDVETIMNRLLTVMESDKIHARVLLTQYINSCLSDSIGPINPKFQAAIIGCTLEDQKDTRKKLETLLCAL